MCDLHQNTLSTATPRGAIPDQIDYAIQHYPGTEWIKLYNSGNFFDPRSIPPDDYEAILERYRHTNVWWLRIIQNLVIGV